MLGPNNQSIVSPALIRIPLVPIKVESSRQYSGRSSHLCGHLIKAHRVSGGNPSDDVNE